MNPVAVYNNLPYHHVVWHVVVVHVVVGQVVVDSNWVHWSSSNLLDLMDWSWSLLGHQTTSLNISELSKELLLGLSNINSVIKIHVGNLGSLDIIVNWHHIDVLTSLNCLVNCGESFFGSGHLWCVLNRNSRGD